MVKTLKLDEFKFSSHTMSLMKTATYVFFDFSILKFFIGFHTSHLFNNLNIHHIHIISLSPLSLSVVIHLIIRMLSDEDGDVRFFQFLIFF